MADTGRTDDGTDDRPSLEMPSFSLRRRRRAPEQDAATDPAPRTAVPTPLDPVEQPTAVVPAAETREEAYDDPAGDREARQRRRLPVPALSRLPAAAVTGLVVGALAVLLVWLAATGCSAVRGTSSCGGGPGLLILVGVLVLLAYAGSWLLGRFGVPEAGSTSLLAVGVMAVLVMVFLLESLDEWWSLITVPLTAVVAYALSWRVTTAVVDTETTDDPRAPHDVR